MRRRGSEGATPERLRRLWRIVEPSRDPHFELHYTMFSGQFCWLVEKPQLLKNPIVCPGKLNLWSHQAERLPD